MDLLHLINKGVKNPFFEKSVAIQLSNILNSDIANHLLSDYFRSV
jgi:hypothetical protein